MIKTVEQQVEERFSDTPVMIRIASCESGLRQFNMDGTVLRGVINPKDIGVFQINTDYHLEEAERLGIDIFTTKGNLEYAYVLYINEGTKPWNWSAGCWNS